MMAAMGEVATVTEDGKTVTAKVSDSTVAEDGKAALTKDVKLMRTGRKYMTLKDSEAAMAEDDSTAKVAGSESELMS